ncbi:uracil phosphoribosyltransferase [Flavobacterium akiainvivens]|uniref:Uracil phosphoribosyltransferase n=1 Tax=Flavobacterium akiainvivens TaxID=1202724 RepID=A0A0M8MJZ2_9FLAO|nr:uracil phosphoribosyltransferase [Flavobacterium akiainvivens]KOS07088.1 uracil phosphoribosyltransferase [Flavobacterium akiainvivens]SFQ75540.1 uracil phosphoribosyltransferase [Flavobacterium akiainvivens]
MTVHYLSENNSILNHFVAQLRDVGVQGDRMRFRQNLHRIGEVMAYEISKNLHYAPAAVTTPLGVKETAFIADEVVVCSILRAGLALHEGLLSFFDGAENGFVSAYRHHPNNDDYFEIVAEYMAVPNLTGKTLILADPMLATGFSAEAVYKKLAEKFTPAQVHLAVVIAAPEGVAYLQEHLPDSVHLWVASLDSHLNEKKYIVPGLGDAGDLAYGVKL